MPRAIRSLSTISAAPSRRRGPWTYTLVAHTGYALRDRNRGEQWAAAVVGLRAAGDLAASVGVRLAVEPLNSSIDHPGYFLNSLSEADLLLREVNHPAVRLLLDVYHMCIAADAPR